jgi:exonuclease VII large subunit
LARLEDLSPLKVLARGYSVSRALPDHRLIRSLKDVKIGTEVETILTDGRLISKVSEIDKNRLN